MSSSIKPRENWNQLTELDRNISIKPGLRVNHRPGNNFCHLLLEIASRKRFLDEIKIDMIVLK